jgi:putative FmdB family regulatory protein
MPILEFSCRACGHQFEFLKLPATTANPRCPTCQGEDLERLLSGFSTSTPELTQTRVKAARKAHLESKDTKDKRVADAEYRKDHRH